MASGLLAAIAAFLAALFAIAAPQPGSDQARLSEPGVAGDASVQRSADDLRAAIRSMVEDAFAGATAEPPSATLRPAEPGASPPQESNGEDCESEEASGEGWRRTEVRCLRQSGASSSVSVSSSSSVTVQETTSE